MAKEANWTVTCQSVSGDRAEGRDMKTPRYVAEQRRPHLIVGDGYGNEEAVRRVAKGYPTTAFVLGLGIGTASPECLLSLPIGSSEPATGRADRWHFNQKPSG